AGRHHRLGNGFELLLRIRRGLERQRNQSGGMRHMKVYLIFAAALIFGCGPSSAGGANDCTDPATCPDNASCPPGVLRCGPNKSVEKCNDSGTAWMPLGHCGDSQSCSGGQCSPSNCSGMATQCTPDGRIQTCLPTSGTYSDPVSC